MMDLYSVSEEAYKNGYAAGLVDGKKEAMKCVNTELLKDVLDAVAGCSVRHCDACHYHKECIDVLSHDAGILYRQIFGGVKAMITDMDCETADVVEVVRCKDCVHRDPEDKKCDSAFQANGGIFPVGDNDFCSYGERRKEDGTVH